MFNKDQIVIYKDKDGEFKVDVTVRDEMVWLSLNQLVELFGRDKSVISRHIKNIFKEQELELSSVVANFATTESGLSSPSSKRFLICLEITDLSLSKRLEIWFRFSQKVSPSN